MYYRLWSLTSHHHQCYTYDSLDSIDEQLHKRLCRRCNSLNTNIFSKLGRVTLFSTIDLHSGYYHIGLTREPRAKSAFVVPMGKWQFKRMPFGLSQAPAYFQLLIDKVLMGCSSFPMGYLDDIIIFSKTEEEHLQHLRKFSPDYVILVSR